MKRNVDIEDACDAIALSGGPRGDRGAAALSPSAISPHTQWVPHARDTTAAQSD